MNNYPSLYFRQEVGGRSVFVSVFLPSLLYYILSVYIALYWQVYAVLQGAFHAVHRLGCLRPLSCQAFSFLCDENIRLLSSGYFDLYHKILLTCNHPPV